MPEPELHAMLKISAAHAARLAPELAAATPPRSFIVHNVNFPMPCHAHTEVRPTVPARVVVPGLFSPAADDGTRAWCRNYLAAQFVVPRFREYRLALAACAYLGRLPVSSKASGASPTRPAWSRISWTSWASPVPSAHRR